jgi:outer membrane protein W
MRFHHVVLAAGLTLAAASTSILAKDPSWTLRFHGAIVDSSGESRASISDGIDSSVEAGGGFGIGAEYRLSRRYGLEFSTLFAGLDIRSRVGGGDGVATGLEMTMMPMTFAFPFHFDAGGRADLFVAPTFSIVRYVDIHTSVNVAGVDSGVDVDSDAALGAALGVDVPFGKGKWAFSSSLRYMRTGFEDTDVDPVIVTVGFAYRFGKP